MALFGRKQEDTGTPFPDIGVPNPNEAPQAQDYSQMQDPNAPPGMFQPEMPLPGMPDPNMQSPTSNPYQQMPPPGMPPTGMPQQSPPSGGEGMEEIAEAVVQEKWMEAKKELNKIEEWKEDVTDKITHLTQRVDDLKGQFDSLHKGMLGKISEYDGNLTNVGTEIKAMEKVFSKVLPALTDSVNKLQRYSGHVEKEAVRKRPRL